MAAQKILNRSMRVYGLVANPWPLTLGGFLHRVIFIRLVVGRRWIEGRFGWS